MHVALSINGNIFASYTFWFILKKVKNTYANNELNIYLTVAYIYHDK
jgi:hypothetical protein